MRTNQTRWMALSAALLLAVPFVASSQIQIPAAINYQGRLTDTLGNPVASGYYEIEFRIWGDAVSTNAADLIWGRSFPLHVVTNGLFNILLTDDGGVVHDPTTPTNTLYTAFGAETRYLGLTITVSNGLSVKESEISPRQQLASAPFAIQAQNANLVGKSGVSTSSLQNYAVTTTKIAPGNVTSGSLADKAVTTDKIADLAVTTAQITNGAVTTPKIADVAVTTPKIADGAVTSSKLNVDGDVHLNDHVLYLRNGSDTNHGLKYAGSFAGLNIDGPALFGFSGGVLGTVGGGEKAALTWDNAGIFRLFGPAVNVTSFLPTNSGGTHGKGAGTTVLQAKVDGLLMYYTYASSNTVEIADSSGNDVLVDQIAVIDSSGAGANGKLFTWPISKGETITLDCVHIQSAYYRNQLIIVPLGLNAPTNRDDVMIQTN